MRLNEVIMYKHNYTFVKHFKYKACKITNSSIISCLYNVVTVSYTHLDVYKRQHTHTHTYIHTHVYIWIYIFFPFHQIVFGCYFWRKLEEEHSLSLIAYVNCNGFHTFYRHHFTLSLVNWKIKAGKAYSRVEN